MSRRRVVVTGMGMVSPLGNTVDETWKGIIAGQNGIGLIDQFDTTQYNCKICGSVKNFDPTAYMTAKEARHMDPFIHYGVAAATQALHDAHLTVTEAEAGRVGVAIGAGMCGLSTLEKYHEILLKEGPRKLSPFFIPAIITNMLSGQVSIMFGLKGPTVSVVSACSTGTHNIGFAGRMIQDGDADVMVCGGAEMAITPLGVGGFCALRALSTRNDAPEKASRPWDKDRDGFVMGEGAGVLVLEELEHAKKRGAKIYAEFSGFGMSSDATHMTLPDQEGRGAAASMANAIKDGHLKPSEVNYINAHGTSTPPGDAIEILAIKKTFDDHAYRLAVSSTKSSIGHLLGAAGAVEAIFCILAIRDQVAPPTRNLDNPSEGCDLNLVPHHAQPYKIDVALSNSFGFGGTNSTIIFKKFD
ncbi:MAG: beta-ketoacyl-[acyl-carrier-protein] synthase II [Gammaproteobacteria bacterium GWE2_42_36]|nr:MAG: beta-ketoacyl-[acyl-carrier-protein] synthase II [Gammaproteobacteria bacterium GWE2_42_36]HCU04934.1 beta-ketoacyl-[acyl-carrier-protein] synthase II [Coxiellaceae bacterium]